MMWMSLNPRAPVKGASIMHNIRNMIEPNVIFRKVLEKSSVCSRMYVAMAERTVNATTLVRYSRSTVIPYFVLSV